MLTSNLLTETEKIIQNVFRLPLKIAYRTAISPLLIFDQHTHPHTTADAQGRQT